MAVRWRADDGQRLNAGLVALFFRGSRPVLLRNPIFLLFSRGGGGTEPLPPPPLDLRISDHTDICSSFNGIFRPVLYTVYEYYLLKTSRL